VDQVVAAEEGSIEAIGGEKGEAEYGDL